MVKEIKVARLTPSDSRLALNLHYSSGIVEVDQWQRDQCHRVENPEIDTHK